MIDMDENEEKTISCKHNDLYIALLYVTYTILYQSILRLEMPSSIVEFVEHTDCGMMQRNIYASHCVDAAPVPRRVQAPG
jgi:hypothetical protein